jgi:hypothetical protein
MASGNDDVNIEIDRSPKGRGKAFGGGDRDQWNERLANLFIRALSVDQSNAEVVSEAGSAVEPTRQWSRITS